MNLFTAHITLKLYQNVGSIVIFTFWIYIIIQSIGGVNDYKKASGKSFTYLFNPFNNRQLKSDRKQNKDLACVVKKFKSRGKKLFFLWALVCVLYVIGAAIIAHS